MQSKKFTAWLESLQTTEHLYAIISSTSDVEPVRHYFQLDGREPVYPLYANTPYADWNPVMPYLARLNAGSHFLDWIRETTATDWGWLFTSTSSTEELASHLTSLTQVLMPDHSLVFFRYWDTDYLRAIFHYLNETTSSLLPPMSSCWLNGESFSFQANTEQPARPDTWWHVPQQLLDVLENTDNTPLINNLMLFVQENRGDLWLGFPPDILKMKVQQFVDHYAGDKEQIAQQLCQQLTDELTI